MQLLCRTGLSRRIEHVERKLRGETMDSLVLVHAAQHSETTSGANGRLGRRFSGNREHESSWY